MSFERMDFLRIARSILAKDVPSDVVVTATMCDGAGQDVEYDVKCDVGPGGFDVSSVTRKDTSQDVAPDAFKIMYGKAALLKLKEQAAEVASEIADARAAEALDAARSDAAENRMDSRRMGEASTRVSAEAPSGLAPHEYAELAMDCLDQAGMSRHGQDAVFEVIQREIEFPD